MFKKTLLNNLIVLLAYGLPIALFLGDLYGVFPIRLHLFTYRSIFSLSCMALYILCGFILIPVKKRIFLSVISPMVAIIFVVIAVMLPSAGVYDGTILYAFNPVFLLFFAEGTPLGLLSFAFILTPVLPSLLFFLGMLLRRLYIRLKKRGQNADEPPLENISDDETKC